MIGDTKKLVNSAVVTLATTTLGLVGALAWNDAIQAILKQFTGGDDIKAKVIYAVVATIIALVVVVGLAKYFGRKSEREER